MLLAVDSDVCWCTGEAVLARPNAKQRSSGDWKEHVPLLCCGESVPVINMDKGSDIPRAFRSYLPTKVGLLLLTSTSNAA